MKTQKEWALHKYFGKEVYVAVTVKDIDSLSDPIGIGITPKETLSSIKPEEIDGDFKLLHGILMPATVLPTHNIQIRDMLKAGCRLFLIMLTSTTKPLEGVGAEYNDLEDIEKDIVENMQFFYDYSHYESDFIGTEPIENYYVLYGYAMPLSLTVANTEYRVDKYNKAVQAVQTMV